MDNVEYTLTFLQPLDRGDASVHIYAAAPEDVDLPNNSDDSTIRFR